MKNKKGSLCIIFIFAMLFSMFAGCRASEQAEEREFHYSEGLDERGFWQGVKALDYVNLFNYRAMTIPNDVHYVSDSAIQSVFNDILVEFPVTIQVMEREVVLFDTVNIHYAGSVDGVAFAGGTGFFDLVIGSGSFIPGFEEQLIGAMPGEIVNVEVTFPDFYPQNTDLEGKDAVFVTTINYIVETEIAEMTDEFVFENFFMWGWATIEELEEGIRKDLQNHAIRQYIQHYLLNEVVVNDIPNKLIKYQERATIHYFQEYADMYDMEMQEFLVLFVGFSSIEELLEFDHSRILDDAVFSLIIQAIAEDMGLTVSEADLSGYFLEHTGWNDYSMYEEMYGLPYLKQIVLIQKVLDYIFENAVLL